MMNDFLFYFKIGWEHILSWDATDHLLFMVALSIVYTYRDYKKVLVLVTAFTIGHAITLYLTALDQIRVNTNLVELLIPCTILMTSLFNILYSSDQQKGMRLQYGIALCFGLIHGMGYANYIRMMLASDQHLIWGLFSFNVGLEMGQIVAVLVVILITWLCSKISWLSRKYLIASVSVCIGLASIYLIISR
jgi:hydrogenase/urease accessory protein HupE